MLRSSWARSPTTVRNLFDHHFALKPVTRVYIPTDEGRELGEAIKSQIEALWTPPAHYFHLQQGGHVAAVREYKDEIGRAHVCTPVTNAHLVCRLLLEKTKTHTLIESAYKNACI